MVAESLETRLRHHLTVLCEEIGPRSILDAGELEQAGDYIEETLTDLGYTVQEQEYVWMGRTFCNLAVRLPGETRPDEVVVVGAHYDTVPGTPGADDNGSGVAALLELARLCREMRPGRTLHLVAFTLEEPPAFFTPWQGSRVYARSLHQRRERVLAMLSLEMLGYYSDRPRSQRFPFFPMRWMYPNTGNFIGIVGNLRSRDLVRRVRESFQRGSPLPVETLSTSPLLPGVALSDHASFWRYGYPAVMVTDTAFYRNPHYHRPSDRPETLDLARLAQCVRGLMQVVTDLVQGGDLAGKRNGGIIFPQESEKEVMMNDFLEEPPDLLQWSWNEIELYYRDLRNRSLSPATVHRFLVDWTRLNDLLEEMESRLHLATVLDTADEEAERRYRAYLEQIYPGHVEEEQKLKEKLLASGLEPTGFEIPLRKMRTEAAIFREVNVPLASQERALGIQFNKVLSAQTVEWDGQEVTIPQLRPVYQEADRGRRERAWLLAAQRQLADRETINDLWQQFLSLRRQMARNAGFPDYRTFRWQQRLRFDYTPEDCLRFHRAIEEVVVPAAARLYERRRRLLGVKTLRPWDLDVDPLGRPPLKPFRHVEELQRGAAAIFHRVDPRLGEYFDLMVREGLLDLANRKNKGPGAFCTSFPASRKPFIFQNAVGLHDDVQTLLHESGHAFHVFERIRLPYFQQRQVGSEFNEVASMAMEFLAMPYLTIEEGGFYSPDEAARARIEHLEKSLLFWPYMAVVDAFQHWVYENPDLAMEPRNCDAQWAALWNRFMVGVDWGGLEEAMMTGWQRKHHIHLWPFYYVEYGLAQLGAVQVWENALSDQSGAVAAYRRALALGGTVPLPQLYETAGARLSFDAETLGRAVRLIEETILSLEKV